MAVCVSVNAGSVRASLNSKASSMAIFTPSPANGGIQWAASPSSVISDLVSHFWSKGMQYCGLGIKSVFSPANNSCQTLLHSENSPLNQANTCLLSLKSIPLSLCQNSSVLQAV